MARQNRRSLVLLGERMCWQCRRPPERPGEKTCWPSHIRRRLETDTYLGTGVGHFAVGSPAACGAVGKTIGRTTTGWRFLGQHPADSGRAIRDPFDKETFQAPSFGPLAWRSTGSRRPWTHAAVGGTGGRGGADQATLLWPLRSRLGRQRPASSAPPGHRHPAGAGSGYRISVAYLALPTVPEAERSRVARKGTAQRLWSHRASLGGSVVGRLPAQQTQHRDAVVRRLRRRPGARFGLSAGAARVGGDCRTGGAGPRLRAPTGSRPHRRNRLASSPRQSLAVDGGQRPSHGVRHSLAPRHRGGP